MATERDFIRGWPSDHAYVHEVRAWIGTYFTLRSLREPVASVDRGLAEIVNRITWTGVHLRHSASSQQLIEWGMPDYVASKLMMAIYKAYLANRRANYPTVPRFFHFYFDNCGPPPAARNYFRSHIPPSGASADLVRAWIMSWFTNATMRRLRSRGSLAVVDALNWDAAFLYRQSTPQLNELIKSTFVHLRPSQATNLALDIQQAIADERRLVFSSISRQALQSSKSKRA